MLQQVLIGLNVVSIAFSAGALVTLVKTHGSDIAELKKDRTRQDREIGVLYGREGLSREVRS